jgi:hypothetical protein
MTLTVADVALAAGKTYAAEVWNGAAVSAPPVVAPDEPSAAADKIEVAAAKEILPAYVFAAPILPAALATLLPLPVAPTELKIDPVGAAVTLAATVNVSVPATKPEGNVKV